MANSLGITCTGKLKAVSLEPALAAFFGVESDNLSSLAVDCEFLVKNDWQTGFAPGEQRITITKVNGIDIDYDTTCTSQTGRIDLYDTVSNEALQISTMIGIDRFVITDITKSGEEDSE